MKRDFSSASRQKLLDLVDDVEREKFSDITDWIGDAYYTFQTWIGRLNINNYINQGEIFFSEDIDLNFYLNENPYTFQPSYVVTKLEKNKFVFKVQYQLLFIWFVVKFNEI